MPSFNRFVRFAYYTGARKIRSISRDNVLDDSLIVFGKSIRRMVKLNSHLKKILRSQKELWNYSKDYVKVQKGSSKVGN